MPMTHHSVISNDSLHIEPYSMAHTVLQFLVQLYLLRVRISCMFVTPEIISLQSATC